MPPLYALSLPALGGLRLRQGEEDVRKLTPGGLLLKNLLLFLANRREYGSLPTLAQPPAPSCSRPVSEKPLRRAHRALPSVS